MSQEENKSENTGQTTENKPKSKVSIFTKYDFSLVALKLGVLAIILTILCYLGLIRTLILLWILVILLVVVFSIAGLFQLLVFKTQKSFLRVLSTIILSVLLVVGFFWTCQRMASRRGLAASMICGTNLKGLGCAIMVYANDHDNKFPAPDKWCDLLIKYADVVPKQFFCVSSDAQKSQSCYSFNSNLADKSVNAVPPDIIVLFETKGGWNQYGGRELLTLENHQCKGCHILFADGHVEWIQAENINRLKWEVNEMAIQLKTGDKAPGFELLDQDSNEVKLTDFAGKKVLLYFYPKADTPGCTTQACSMRDSAEPLKELGVVALGISPDDPNAQKKFDEKYSLGFLLLSDVNHKTAQDYGVWGEKVRDGKKTMGIIRSSFLIDEQGKIIQSWYNVSPADTVPNALAALKEK